MVAARTSLSEIVKTFEDLQDEITSGLEALDGEGRFHEDRWLREKGGGGRTRILLNGQVFEKAGVAFSHVSGPLPEAVAAGMNAPAGTAFDATGVSIVIHPSSPRLPIIHMNIRYFCMEGGNEWFGGGIDLTPIYLNPEDAHFFHAEIRKVCDRYSVEFYPKYKKWCDEYFYIKHRKETRGIGGVFFDHLTSQSPEERQLNFEFTRALGRAFVPIYAELINRHRNEPFTEREKQFQLLRRSRYVEFNLVYDRGTRFGLETDGRIESIMMSMPPQANWTYNYQPEKGSPEAFTLEMLRPTDWLKG